MLPKSPQNSSHFFLGFLLLVLTSLSCIWVKHHKIIKNLGNEKMIDSYGDGLKTYTNAAYHIDYDSTFHWFDGMNYPYGEHLVAATELPGIAIGMKALRPLFPNISDSIIGVVHFEMLLAILLCSIFMFLIFRELGLPITWCIILAIGITFLAPQNMRMRSHYGLAQPFVVPALIYFLLKFYRSYAWRWSFAIATTIFVSSFLHFYFFAITMFLVGAVITFSLIFNFSKENLLKTLPQFIIMVGIPLVFFWFWMLGVDPISDRSPNPYGFFRFASIWETIFVRPSLPYYEWINENVTKIQKGSFEGTAYVGLPAFVFTIFFLLRTLFYGIKSPFQKSILPFVSRDKKFLQALTAAGFALLVFAFAWPFYLDNMKWVLNYLGPIKQFRSVGRFAWIFYFIINILTFTALYSYYKNQKIKWKKYGLVSIVFLIFAFEVLEFNDKLKINLSEVFYFKEGLKFTDIETIDYNKYQASIALPYFNVGSNNYERGLEGFSAQTSFSLALQTGIPTTGAMLTRSSRSQIFRQWQMLTEPYRTPVIFEDYGNDKPLILFWFKAMKKSHKAEFEHLLDGANLLFERKSLQIYETELSAFQNRIDKKIEEVERELKGNLFEHQQLLSSDSVVNYVYQNFDNLRQEDGYLGSGALTGIAEEENIIYQGKIPAAQIDSSYTFQIWTEVNADRYSFLFYTLREKSLDGKLLQEKKFRVWNPNRTFDPRGWVQLSENFHLKSNKSLIELSFQKKDLGDQVIKVDELLIRPTKTNLYKAEESMIWKNNRHYFKEKN